MLQLSWREPLCKAQLELARLCLCLCFTHLKLVSSSEQDIVTCQSAHLLLARKKAEILASRECHICCQHNLQYVHIGTLEQIMISAHGPVMILEKTLYRF